MQNSSIKDFNVKQFLVNNSAFVILIVLVIIATLVQGTTFFNVINFRNILMNNAIIGIIALGMTLIIISGGIDLSVGAASAATGLIALQVMMNTRSVVLGFIAAIISGAILGAFTGTLVARFRIPAFIVTLGGMRIIRSLAQNYWDGGGIAITPALDRDIAWFLNFSNPRAFAGLPHPLPLISLPVLYWIGLAIIVAFVMRRTALGRHIYAVGSNERASNLSAINVKRVKTYVYMISGALVGFAALVEASRIGSMNSSMSGGFYELEAIAAVVIGGTAMSGGRGRIIGTVFGTLTLGVINNMMNLMGLPPFLVGAIQGSIVVLAVLLQRSVAERERQF